MKNKMWVIGLIVLLSVLAIGLTILMIFMINGNVRYHNFSMFHTVSKNLAFEQTYLEDFSEVDITVGAGNILVKESSDNQVKVMIYGKDEDVTVDTTKGRLKIRVKDDDCHFICFRRTIAKVEVYLPSDYNHSLTIKNQYGDTEIEKLIHAEIDIDQKCGDILVDQAKQIKIQNDYGDISVNQAMDADIQCSFGDIKVGTVSNLTIENHYGDIRIRKVENYLNVKEDCGDIEIGDIVLGKDSFIQNSYGDIEIGFTNEIYIDASTSFGETKLQNNYPKAEVSLKIENSCGDIEVNN